MMEEELIKIWQSSPNQERVKFEKSRLMVEVESHVVRFYKQIKNRDRVDMITIAPIIPVFTIYIFIVTSILSKIALACFVLWAIYMLIRIRKAKRNRMDNFTGTYLEYLYNTRQLLLEQKQIRDAVLYTSIIPATAFTFLFFMGYMKSHTVPIRSIVSFGVGIFVIPVGLHILNKWVIKNEILPRLTKIDELINVMERR
jgi:hypothetical protein